MSKNESNYQKLIENTIAELTAENFAEIDFDKLIKLLANLKSKINSAIILEENHKILQTDYIARISGMLKAIAVVNHSREKNENILKLIESLSGLDALSLTGCYRKVSAKFREAFPTSFGLVDHIYKPKLNFNQYK